MATSFKRHRFLFTLSALAAFLVFCALVLPWRSWVEGRLKNLLEEHGYKNVHLTLSNIGLSGVSLSEIKLGEPEPLTLKNVTLTYSLQELLAGHAGGLTVSGLDFNVLQTGKEWKISGLENKRSAGQSGEPFVVPVTREQIDSLPLSQVHLDHSVVHLALNQGQGDVPVQLTWQKEPVPTFAFKTTGGMFKGTSAQITTGVAVAEGALNSEAKQWEGTWSVQDIKVSAEGADFPIMKGSGKLFVQADRVVIQGQFISADQTHKLLFNYKTSFTAPEKAELMILNASMSLMGGMLSAQQVRIAFGGRPSLTVNLKLQGVSIEALLQQVTGKQTAATGSISGFLPVTIEENGKLVFHEGTLRADAAGTIALPPESIPGDNEQVAFVREVLKNLQYTLFSLHIKSDKKNRPELLMAVEGKNPDVLSGRPVKINVHLTGDMLDFVQQNILFLSDPKKLLERGENEKK
jgi:hypothetical protein